MNTITSPDALDSEQLYKELRRPLKHVFTAGEHLSSAHANLYEVIVAISPELSDASVASLIAAVDQLSAASDELQTSVFNHRDVFDSLHP